MMFVGIMLAIDGIAQCILAFGADAFGRGSLIFAVGALTAAVGFYLLNQPLAGLAAITLCLAAYFVGTGNSNPDLDGRGRPGGNLTASDSETGKIFWQFNTGADVNAPPIAFELDGEEFIAVAAGGSDLWGSPKGDAVFVFGLPKKWELGAAK